MKPLATLAACGAPLGRAVHGLALTVGLIGASTNAYADTITCSEVSLTFEPRHALLAQAACEHLQKAKQLLAECGLEQHDALNVEIADRVDHPAYGQCLGYFDTGNNCLKIANPDAYTALLSEKDARAALPPDVVFASIITHEVTHALLMQAPGAKTLGAAEHEFLAAAFEMATMDAKWRDSLLKANPIKSGGSVGLVNPGIYALSPRAFANNAWLLFQKDGNGCDLVQRIVSGAFRFPRN